MKDKLMYKVISGRIRQRDGWDDETLSDRVNEAIEEGWIPLGGISIDPTSDWGYQAMTNLPL